MVAAHWIVGSGSLECPMKGSLGCSREARWDAGGGSHTPGSLWSLVGVGLAKKNLKCTMVDTGHDLPSLASFAASAASDPAQARKKSRRFF